MSLVGWLDDRFYPGHGSHWDDLAFADRVAIHLSGEEVLLDLGAGAGVVPQLDFRGKVATVVGVDPDPRVLANPRLDEARVGVGDDLPAASESVDIVVCANVFEHLERPEAVFMEVARVLRPGGLFLVKTPNRAHYVTLAARWTPLWFHQFYNQLRGRKAEDSFATKYAANSESALRLLARSAGLDVVELEFVEGRPEYLRLNALMYAFGIAYERLVNHWGRLAKYRAVIIAQFRKPEDGNRNAPRPVRPASGVRQGGLRGRSPSVRPVRADHAPSSRGPLATIWR